MCATFVSVEVFRVAKSSGLGYDRSIRELLGCTLPLYGPDGRAGFLSRAWVDASQVHRQRRLPLDTPRASPRIQKCLEGGARAGTGRRAHERVIRHFSFVLLLITRG